MRLTVLTDDEGNLVATQVGRTGLPDRRGSVIILAAASPGQRLHKTEFEIPRITSRGELERFHKQLSKHLSAH
ncbi:MAG: hypothetical protein WAJ94_09335 [Candidatus Cybelea sp.]